METATTIEDTEPKNVYMKTLPALPRRENTSRKETMKSGNTYALNCQNYFAPSGVIMLKKTKRKPNDQGKKNEWNGFTILETFIKCYCSDYHTFFVNHTNALRCCCPLKGRSLSASRGL